MKTILTMSIALNVILIYNLGKQRETIALKQSFIDKWIDKEKTFIKDINKCNFKVNNKEKTLFEFDKNINEKHDIYK